MSMLLAVLLFVLTCVLMLLFSRYRPYIALASGALFVALGMLPMCSDEALRARIKAVLEKEALPVMLSEAAPDPERVIASAMHDKKADGESIVTVRLDDIGSFRFEAASRYQLMEDYLEVFG